MRGSYIKSPSFLFGAPFNRYTQSSEDHREFGDNFYKVLCSWLNFRDFIPVGHNPEIERVRNVFSAMFQANQKEMINKHKKRKFRETRHVLKIDLDKIDKKLRLSNKEKQRLRHILKQIKCRESVTKLNKTERENSAVLRKTKKSLFQGKNAGRARKSITTEHCNGRKKCHRENKHCTLCLEEIKTQNGKRNQMSHMTKITPSEERLFKTLMTLDRSCCAGSFKTLFDQKSKRTFITQTQNINIENLELKYIQPTCLLQYTDMKKELSRTLPKVAFPQSVRNLTRTSIPHYEDNTGTGYILNESLFMTKNKPADRDKCDEITATEKRGATRSSKAGIQNEMSEESKPEIFQEKIDKDDYGKSGNLMVSRDILVSPQCDVEVGLCKEQITSTRSNKEYPSKCKIPIRNRKSSSKGRRFKTFVRKCFCLCGRAEDDDEKYLSRHCN